MEPPQTPLKKAKMERSRTPLKKAKMEPTSCPPSPCHSSDDWAVLNECRQPVLDSLWRTMVRDGMRTGLKALVVLRKLIILCILSASDTVTRKVRRVVPRLYFHPFALHCCMTYMRSCTSSLKTPRTKIQAELSPNSRPSTAIQFPNASTGKTSRALQTQSWWRRCGAPASLNAVSAT